MWYCDPFWRSKFVSLKTQNKKDMKKTAIKISLLIVMMMSLLNGEATVPMNFRIYSIGEKRINIQAFNIIGRSTLVIQDENKEALLERTFKSGKQLEVTLDLNTLTDGNYEVILKDESKIQSVPLLISKEGLVVNMNAFHKTYFPQIISNNNEIVVKMLSNDSDDLAIDIKNKYGDPIYSTKVDGRNGLIGKRFEFAPGEYEITLASGEYERTQLFVIR